ncbi:hypothetical protein KGV52_01270, partial [Candidatus Gracilibacteria bacterium]|nr:hypothetical protein [Candidatus Gracilibacteria bacterium]
YLVHFILIFTTQPSRFVQRRFQGKLRKNREVLINSFTNEFGKIFQGWLVGLNSSSFNSRFICGL